MTLLGYEFDATKVPVEAGGTANLPISDSKGHIVWIIGSERKPAKTGNGDMLEFILEIIDGPLKGITGAHRLNLWNNNEDTRRIAHTGQVGLSALCHVTSQFNLSDSRGGVAVLYRIPFRAIVEQQKKDPQYTEVSKILDINGNEPHKAGQGPPAAQAGAWTAPKENTPVPTGGTGAWTQPADKTAVDPAPAPGPWQPSSEAPKTAPWNK